MLDLGRVKQTYKSEPPSSAYLKAFRALCLLLKSLTPLHSNAKSIKHDECFSSWHMIRQYLSSQQGQSQLK